MAVAPGQRCRARSKTSPAPGRGDVAPKRPVQNERTAWLVRHCTEKARSKTSAGPVWVNVGPMATTDGTALPPRRRDFFCESPARKMPPSSPTCSGFSFGRAIGPRGPISASDAGTAGWRTTPGRESDHSLARICSITSRSSCFCEASKTSAPPGRGDVAPGPNTPVAIWPHPRTVRTSPWHRSRRRGLAGAGE